MKYYFEISNEEYIYIMGSNNVIVGTNKVPWTENEKLIIQKKLEDFKSKSPYFNFKIDTPVMGGKKDIHIITNQRNVGLMFGIEKVMDEWFVAYRHLNETPFDSAYWKCDQFDGLIKWLDEQVLI